MTGTVFPAFIKLEYQNDGSAKGNFLRAVDDMTGAAEQRFKQFASEANRQLDAALSVKRTSTGSLDIGAEQARAMAAAAQARAVAAREIANATRVAATEAGDYSQATRLAIAATEAQAAEEERAAKSALSHAAALEQVQAVLSRQTSATDAVVQSTRRGIIANDNGAVSAGQHRAALQQLSYQISDVAQGFALGINPMVIFAQQGAQVTQAIGLLRGTAGGLAGFMAGPWGAAILGGVTVLGFLVPKLLETGNAMDAVKFSSNAMADAQGILGNVLDITTGKVEAQNSALIALARAQILVGKVQAQARAAEARSQISASGQPQFQFGGGFGGGISISRARPIQGQVASQFLNGVLDTDQAVRKLEALRDAGRITDETFASLAASYANLGVELANAKIFEQAEKLLNGQGGRELLKPAKARTPHAPRSAGDKGLAEFGEDAAAKLARIQDQFSDLPPAVRQANEAVRQLDDLISDLERRKPEGFAAIVAQAKELKAVIPTAAETKAFADLAQEAQRRGEIAALTAQGRDAEANALQTIWQMERNLKPLAEERKADVRAIAEAEEAANEALARRQQQMSAYLEAGRSFRSELENLFTGRGANFGQIFKDLQGKALVNKLFGDVFSQMDKWVAANTPLDAAITKFAGSTSTAGEAALNLARTFDQAAQTIAGATGGGAPGIGTASGNVPPWAAGSPEFYAAFAKAFSKADRERSANDNGAGAGGRVDQPPIPNQNTLGGITPKAYAELLWGGVTKPLVGAIAAIAPEVAAVIGPVLNGALGGLSLGGIPGGIFGGLKNIPGLSKGLFDKFTAGLDGAITGTIVSGIAQSLGIKNFSTTGSQIGGAIGGIAGTAVGGLLGSVLGPVGSILGGLLGSLFHSAKWGYAQVSNTGINTGSNRAEEGQAASQAGDAVSQGIQRIADALGGQIGSYLVSIGVTDGHWRYSTTGRTGELKSKYSDVHLTGDGEEGYQAALRAAISDAIRDGAIVGIRVTTQKILQAGGDIEQQLQKAVDFESVFKRLKQIKDPVGAAIDELNTEFNKLKAIFVEAGASVEEYAQLEELYGLERAKAVKQAMDQISSSLQSLYDDLTLNNPTLSLTDRKAEALAKYTPLAAKVAAGDLTASDDFAAVARTLLDIQRQLYGSGAEFFALQDQVKSLTENALDAVTSVANASANSDSPFTSVASASANDNAATVSAVNSLSALTNDQLSAVNSNLGVLIRQNQAAAAADNPTFPPLSAAGYW